MTTRFMLVLALVCVVASGAMAQDPVKVDPKHYTLVSENAEVRILRVHYGPHEKSVMHSHPDAVVVFLADAHIKFGTPDGKSTEDSGKANEARFTPAGTHLPENLGDKPVEAILVELKSKPVK